MSESVCPICETAQQVHAIDGKVWATCVSCQALLFVPTGGPRVLVGHASDNLCQYVGAVLVEAGFSPLRAPDGEVALRLLSSHRPAAAVLDVGLTGVLAFEVIDYVRRELADVGTKVVLLASVYSRTAYKRNPTSLYGADDYVEQHHIPDKLPTKLCELLDIDASGVAALAAGRFSANVEPSDRTDVWGRDRVWALAHSIVSDIALYYQQEFEQAANNGGLAGIAAPLDEGRMLLAKMADRSEYPSDDPIADAFELFVGKMRRDA
ncbi:MAG: hypothetical protein AAB426_13150 [Myxococcota bacterium]